MLHSLALMLPQLQTQCDILIDEYVYTRFNIYIKKKQQQQKRKQTILTKLTKETKRKATLCKYQKKEKKDETNKRL